MVDGFWPFSKMVSKKLINKPYFCLLLLRSHICFVYAKEKGSFQLVNKAN